MPKLPPPARWGFSMRLLVASLVLVTVGPAIAQTKVDFNRDVRPILSDNCFACHGPDDKARKADLRLDQDDGLRSVVDLKKPAESELVRRVTTTAKQDRMPPAKTGKMLTPAQIETLKAWVAQGAEYQGHWAFIAPKRPAVPTRGRRMGQERDRPFIVARLEGRAEAVRGSRPRDARSAASRST